MRFMKEGLVRIVGSIVATCLLLSVAPCARAAGLNLRWDQCYGDGGVFSKTFACDTNAGTNVVVGSFVLSSDLAGVTFLELDLDVTTAAETLPAWWQFQSAGSCRQTSLTASSVEDPNYVICSDWASGAAAGGLAAYTIGNSGPNTAHIKLAFAVAAQNAADLQAAQEYFSFNLRLNNAKSVGTSACTGCNLAACIAFTSLKVNQGVSSTTVLTTPAYGANSNYVTWQVGPGPPPLSNGTCAEFDTAGFAVSTSLVGRGTITRSRTKSKYPAGSPLTLVAVPSPGDRFVAWSGDTTSTKDTLSVVVYRDLTFFATFERDPAAAATLVSVSDVPSDQGAHVLATWRRSPVDDAAYPGVLCCYWLERTLSTAPTAPWVAASFMIPVSGSSTYSQVVTTPADSTQDDPAQLRYRVITMDAGGSGVWTSNEVVGYSVDNLAPPQLTSVSGVMASGIATMFWSAVSAPDFAHYSIYRGLESVPPTDAAHRVGTTTSTNYTDSPGYFANYRVTSVDRHGNESPGTQFVTLNQTEVPGGPVPKSLSVGNPFPSPMARSMSMTLGLPNAMSATVDVLDSQGRLVRRLCEGERPAGWVTLLWDARDAGGRESAAGMYFVCVQTREGRSVRRLVLIP